MMMAVMAHDRLPLACIVVSRAVDEFRALQRPENHAKLYIAKWPKESNSNIGLSLALATGMRILATLIIWLSGATLYAARPANLVQAELLADVDAVKAAQPFKLGVRLKVKPGWHVYWKYPGDSGAPTQVVFNGPDSWTVGEVLYPIPKTFKQPGDVIGYGYEDEVMLIATVTPPAGLSDSQTVEFTANVKWLSCQDVCIPGKTEVKLTLPIRENSKRANAELFERWQERIPARSGTSLVSASFVDDATSRQVVVAKFNEPVQNIEWFPSPPGKLGVTAAKVEPDPRPLEKCFSFDLLPQQKGGEPMEFVVAYTDSQGKRHAAQFTVDVPPAPQK
jgi:DsbC/DsbD-like thiol-disulfide interchange protein